MDKITISIKKFLQNKNIVTVLGIIIILALLYWGYTSTINAQVAPTSVAVAARTIQPREEITTDMVRTISVPRRSISDNVLRSPNQVIGMWTAVNTIVPQGSMFFREALVTWEQIPDSAFVAVRDGHRPYALAVTTQSTYGNSIFPGNVIDVFMVVRNEFGLLMVGRLLARVEVLAVKDSQGNNVFENTAQNRTPATLLFGVPESEFLLLQAAERLRNHGVELFPVPYGGTAQITADITVGREELVNFIRANAQLLIDDDEPRFPSNQGFDLNND